MEQHWLDSCGSGEGHVGGSSEQVYRALRFYTMQGIS